MSESLRFPIFIVVRNNHIIPPGLWMHRENAEACAKFEEGAVIALVPVNQLLGNLKELIGRQSETHQDEDGLMTGTCLDICELDAFIEQHTNLTLYHHSLIAEMIEVLEIVDSQLRHLPIQNNIPEIVIEKLERTISRAKELYK